MQVTWMRTHVPVRNGGNSITSSFMEPDFSIDLKDRCFYVSKNNKLVTIIPIENIVEFTIQDDAKIKPTRQAN